MKLKGKRVYLAGYSSRAQLSAFYGHFLRVWDKKMRARPFMRPASKAVEAKIPEIFAKHIEAVNDEINRYL